MHSPSAEQTVSEVSVDVITRPVRLAAAAAAGRIQIDMQISDRQIRPCTARAIAAPTSSESGVIAPGTTDRGWSRTGRKFAAAAASYRCRRGQLADRGRRTSAPLVYSRHDYAVLCQHPITPQLLVSAPAGHLLATRPHTSILFIIGDKPPTRPARFVLLISVQMA